MDLIQALAAELGKDPRHVENVVHLLDEGNTIPFIARYRKELHGAMDDTSLRTLEERLQYLRGLEERREAVKKSIDEQGKLTDELTAAIDSAKTLAEVEDLYRPYKQKRRTRATMAKEKGLEPLAALLFAQERDCPRLEEAARDFVDPEKGVETVEDALQGASDIIAEQISDDAAIRKSLRALISRQGQLVSRAATEDDSVYRLYYDFTQSVARLQGHQVLAINRGEKEGILKVSITLDREQALPLLRRAVVKPGSAAMEFVKSAAEDAYDRLIFPSLEREVRNQLTEQADEGAIGQFALNLKPLLMQPPVKGKVTMGLDPGYRMGCKVAVVDGTGKVLDTAVVYPTYGERQKNEAIAALATLIKKHGVEHIAIGNGTASRETEQMAVELIRQVNEGSAHVSYMIVSEAGASVYSASKLAAEEFPPAGIPAIELGQGGKAPPAFVLVGVGVLPAVPAAVGAVFIPVGPAGAVPPFLIEVQAIAAGVVEHAVQNDFDLPFVRLSAKGDKVLLIAQKRVDAQIVGGIIAVVAVRFKDGIEVQHPHPQRRQLRQLFGDARKVAAEIVIAAEHPVDIGDALRLLLPVPMQPPVGGHAGFGAAAAAKAVGENLIHHLPGEFLRDAVIFIVDGELPQGALAVIGAAVGGTVQQGAVRKAEAVVVESRLGGGIAQAVAVRGRRQGQPQKGQGLPRPVQQ